MGFDVRPGLCAMLLGGAFNAVSKRPLLAQGKEAQHGSIKMRGGFTYMKWDEVVFASAAERLAFWQAGGQLPECPRFVRCALPQAPEHHQVLF